MSEVRISRALAIYQRRAIAVSAVRASVVAIGVTLLAAELAPFSLVGLAVGLIIAVAYARRGMPTPLDAARRIDRVARLQDLIVTAVQLEGRDDDMSAAIARAAAAALRAVPAARVYPLEPPHQWRRWAVLAVGVQVLAIALTWRAPDARPMSTGSAALSIPGAGGDGTTPTAPQKNAIAAATAAPTASQIAEAASAPLGVGDSPTGAATGHETSDSGNRYRQAAARAGDALAGRRVPAALRGVVERYFTAIRPQGQ